MMINKLISFFISLLLCNFASAEDLVFPKDSLFKVQGQWTDQNGKSVSLKDFAGKSTILAMVYTGCGYSCPMTISHIQEMLKASEAKNIRVVLASFDTKKDTPQVLKKFIQKRKLNEEIWTMLTASKDSIVRELAIVLGVNYKDTGDGDFSHSNVFTLLSKDGLVLLNLNGFDASTEKFVKTLKEVDAK